MAKEPALLIKPDYNDIFLRGGKLAIIPPPFLTILAKIGWKEKELTLLRPFIQVVKQHNTYVKQSSHQDIEQTTLLGARGSAKEKPTTELIKEIHQHSHQGIEHTINSYRNICSDNPPQLRKIVTSVINNCSHCQRTKPTKRVYHPLNKEAIELYPFQEIIP